jgi:neutral ceramidase
VLSVGFSKVSISPPIGAPLAGFAARQGVCEGIHDDLFARALVIENNGKTVALVSLDVLAVSSEFVGDVRENIERRTGIRQDAVMIAATHTHAGPVTIKTFFNPDESLDGNYMKKLSQAIEDSVAEAFNKRFPARIGVGSGYVAGIGVNRRTVDKQPIDEEIGIIKVEDLDGNTRAVFINYACHPTVLGSNNLLATGDFPYFTVEKIERSINTSGFAMFVNGTQGNISMGHSSELSAIGVITPGRTFEHAEELGHKLADAALEVLSGIETSENVTVLSVTVPFSLPLKKYAPLTEMTDALRKAEEHLQSLNGNNEKTGAELEKFLRAKSSALYASIENYYAAETAKFTDRVMEIELQGIRLGDAVFIAVPAEVFVEIGLQLKKSAPHKTYIVGIANGYIGYLPTNESYEKGGYEVVSARCAPEAHELLIDKVIELEKQMFGETAAV